MRRILLTVVLASLLVGCAKPTPTPTPTPPAPTLVPTNTPLPTSAPAAKERPASGVLGPPALQYMLVGKDLGVYFEVTDEEVDARGKLEGIDFPSDGLEEVSWRRIYRRIKEDTITQYLAVYDSVDNASAALDAIVETAIPADAPGMEEFDSALGDDRVVVVVAGELEKKLGIGVFRINNIVTLVQTDTRAKLKKDALPFFEDAVAKIESSGQ